MNLLAVLLLDATTGSLGKIASSISIGAFAVYLLLPRPRPSPRWLGAALGALALLLAGAFLIERGAFTTEGLLFYAFSGLALVAAGLTITQANPAYAALSFALVVLSTCGLFLLLAAPFLMASTVIVYAGAIVVTFLFVLMLAQRKGPSDADDRSREPVFATLGGFVFLGGMAVLLRVTYDVPRLDPVLVPFLERARVAATKDTVEEMEEALGPDFFDPVKGLIPTLDRYKESLDMYQESTGEDRLPPGLKNYSAKTLEPISNRWGERRIRRDTAQLRQDLQRLVDEGERLRLPLRDKPLSDFSGPGPNADVYRDRHGNAPLPADNVGALGRSLFTDFLLAVELAGTLLLVATIGAVAIACRSAERRT